RERHLLGERLGPEPCQLLDVVVRDGLTVTPYEPAQREYVARAVRVDVRPQPLEGLDLEPGLLAELPPEARQRLLALLQEAAGQVPHPLWRLVLAPADQDAAVADEQPLHGGRRVRPVARAAAGAVAVAAFAWFELVAAARAEPPAVEDAHDSRLLGTLGIG